MKKWKKTEENKNEKSDMIQLKRSIGLLDSVCFLIGSIIGAGIFVSPAGVLKYSCLNVGVALILWAVSGLITIMCSLCYAELGAALPFNGGAYYHVKRGLGSPLAFVFIWTLTIFIRPASNAARALIFAEYATKPFYSGCPTPDLLKKILALAVLWFLGILNSMSVKLALWIQNLFTVLKMMSLTVIIFGGFVLLAQHGKGNIEQFKNAFNSEVPNAVQTTEALFQGLYAYGGWTYLNHMAEEMKNPSKNIPRCVLISLSAVIAFYLLVNISYIAVLTPKEIISSAAVSITWADKAIPSFAWIIPVSVAVSIFGSLNGGMFMLGRLNYAGGKEGHMPAILAMLNVHYLTPAPAIIFSTILASIFVIPSDLLSLANYFGFSSSLLIGLTCTSLIVLRYKEPNLHRPYKVFLPTAFAAVAVSAFLVLAPLIQSPKQQYLYALLFMLSGLLLYLPFIHFKLRFDFFTQITCYLQLILEVSPTDQYDDSKNL